MDSKWLTQQLEKRGKTIASLARVVGRDRAAMSRIVNGEQPFQLWMTPLVAEELGVSQIELLSHVGSLAMPSLSTAAIIPWHAASAFSMLNTPVDVGAARERIPVPLQSDTLIALRVEKDAISAYPPGSLVVIDYAAKSLKDGDIGVFSVDDGTLMMRYRTRGKKIWLTSEPYQGTSETIENKRFEIVGRVVSAPIVAQIS